MLRWPRRLVKPLLFAACMLPLLDLLARVFGIAGRGLGANPIETLMDALGTWGLRFLLLTLCVSPLARIARKPWIMGLRRMLGLFAFTYLALHFLVWLVLDKWFDWPVIVEDIAERPFITLGMIALLMLLALAVTSTRGWMRRLGGRWQRLHRLVYVAASLAVVHYWALVKADTTRPWRYAAIVAALLGVRAWVALRRPRRPASGRADAGARS